VFCYVAEIFAGSYSSVHECVKKETNMEYYPPPCNTEEACAKADLDFFFFFNSSFKVCIFINRKYGHLSFDHIRLGIPITACVTLTHPGPTELANTILRCQEE
jgi:hypothetical protein